MRLDYNLINSKFEDLLFDEKRHKYSLKSKPEHVFTSGTKYISETFGNFFDSEAISKAISKRDNIPQEDILADWKKKNDDSLILGNAVHLYAETTDITSENEIALAMMKQVDAYNENFLVDNIVVSSEYRMYYDIISGTADRLNEKIKTGKYFFTDFKTNKDLFKGLDDKNLKYPFNYFFDCPYSKYIIQLNLYRLIFELNFNIEMDDGVIIWIKEDSYEEFIVPDIRKEIKEQLCW